MIDVFRKRHLELLALAETKLKVNRKISWCDANGTITSVQKMVRAREGGGGCLVKKCVAQCGDRL